MPYSLRKYPQNFLLFTFVDAFRSMFLTKDKWKKTGRNEPYEQYRQTAYYLRRNGFVKIIRHRSGNRELKLTKKGELELLLTKAVLPVKRPWDGKWRMVIFDIPKSNNPERDKLRRLLMSAGFVRLQASVYISPLALNRQAIVYLKDSGLIKYIRFGRIEELDDDGELIRHFKLKRPR